MTKKMVMPWEDRPAGCADIMWRYSKNKSSNRPLPYPLFQQHLQQCRSTF